MAKSAFSSSSGAQGATGPAGSAGSPGAPGQDGDDGLEGFPGATGARGATGATGAGSTGATGPAGSGTEITTKTFGYADLNGSGVFPSSAMGAAEITGYTYVNQGGVASMPSSVKLVTTYISAHESRNDGQTSANTDPELDTDSDASASAMCQHSITTIIGGTPFMKSGGTDIVDGFGAKIPDLSNPEYQRCSALQMVSRAARYGITDYRFDTFNDILYLTGGITTLPDGVDSWADWENRFALPYMKSVFTFLRAHGIRCWINGTGSSDTSLSYHGFGSAYDNRGDGHVKWMNRTKFYCDGYMHENAFQGSDSVPLNDSYAVSGTLTTYKDWWRYWLRIPAWCSANNKGYLMFVYPYGVDVAAAGATLNSSSIPVKDTTNFPASGSAVDQSGNIFTYTGSSTSSGAGNLTGCSNHPAYVEWTRISSRDGQQYRFSRGSALLVWGGTTHLFLLTSDHTTVDTTTTYQWDTGFPKERYHRIHAVSNYVRIRKYDNGVLVVNADPASAHTVNGHSVPALDAWFDVGASY